MAKVRKVRDERDARSLLAKVEASGGEIGAWSRAHGVDGRSLRAWHLNLARGQHGGGAGRRVRTDSSQVSPVRLVELLPRETAPGARYVVRVGAFAVELGDDFREETLGRVLAVLASC